MVDIFKDVRNLSEASIRHFIETGFNGNANFKRDDGDTLLHFAVFYEGNVEVVKVLISMGANVNAKNNNGSTPLHIATNNKNIEVARVLIHKGADVNIAEENGLTPFDIAVLYGEVDVVEACLSHGADVHAIDRNTFTPLHKAAFSRNTANGRNIEIAKLLISKGADINARSKNNDKPLDLAKFINDLQMVLYLLDNEPIENIEQYFKENKQAINSQDETGYTMLHCAAINRYANIAKVLLSIGADVNVCEENGLTPLDIAIGGGEVEIVEILLPHISDINARDKNKLTLLHKAAVSRKMAGDKNIEVAKLLVSKGADINAKTARGTPCDMAKELGDTAMVKYLSGLATE